MQWLNLAVTAIRPKDPADADAQADEELERTYARRVVDLSMRVAETMLTGGASVNDGTIAALQIVKAYGVTPVHVDVTYTSITVSYHRDITEDPLTLTRVLRARTTDYTRLQRLDALTHRIDEGLDIDEAREQYMMITSAPHPYRRAVVTLANGILGAGVSIALGASAVIAFIALLSGVLIVTVQTELSKRQLPSFFTQGAGALIATLIATLTITLSRHVEWFGGVRPSIIVSAVIVMLLAGMAVVGAAQDAIDGFYVTAAARLFEVVMLTLGIVIGIATGLKVASLLGYGFLLPTAAPELGSAQQQMLGAALIAAGYALSAHSSLRTILLGTGTALLAWVAYLFARWIGFSIAPASALGALVASFLAILVARRLNVPSLALATAGIVPFVPGATVFRGLLQLFEAEGSTAMMMNGVGTLMAAGGVGIAIAAGVSLGSYFGRPTRDTITTAVRRLRGAA